LELTCRNYPVCWSVSAWKVYCGKTAEWILTLFGVVSGVGRGMGVLDRGGDHRRGKGMGSFGGKFGASHWNQYGTLLRSCARATRSS